MPSYFIPLVFASGRRRRRSLRHAAVLVLLAAAAFVAASTPGLARDPVPAHTAQLAVPTAVMEAQESVPSVAPIARIFSEQQTAAWAGAQGDDQWLRDGALRTSVPLAPAADALPSSLPPQEQGTWEHLGRPPPAPGGHCV